MQTFRPPFRYALFALCLLAAPAAAQTQAPPAQPDRALVTAAGTSERVRFAAPNRVARLRLEVLSASGDVLFESSSRGSVLDWTLSDAQGGRLADGQYLCVVTVKDAAGRITQRLTLVDIAGGAVTARPASAADMTARQAEAVGPVESEPAGVVAGEETAATLVAHDGREGQLVTTTGDLSFRGGDFFTGRDKELMRLSADGSLEVTGALHARGGIRFADGTVLQSAGGIGRGGKGGKGAGGALPSAAGTGTQNRLAKWAETGGAGTLADSALFESNGNVGLGTTTPAHPFTVRHNIGTLGVHSFGELFVDRDNLTRSASLLMGTAGTLKWLFGIPAQSNGFQIYDLAAQQGRVFVDPGAGFVGINTTTPAQRLHVVGNVQVSGAGNGVIFPDGTKQTTAGGGGGGNVSGTGTTNTVPLWTGPVTLGNSVITQSGGNVGIGAGAPATKLQVVGGAAGGVSASSTGGFALYGDNPAGWAVGAEGNTRQRRDRGGWVKFMIYVDETGAITRCFNSFLADGGASQAGCGFTVTHTAGTGVYSIQFTEAVNDRFYSLAAKAASTTEIPRQNIGVNFELDPNPTTLVVSTYLTSGQSTQTADASFILIVY